MTRLAAIGLSSLGAFSFLFAVLMLAPLILGDPMPWHVATLLAALFAPFLGWRFERQQLELLQSTYLGGVRHTARLPGPTMDYVVQNLARLSPGDVSVLVMALRHPADDAMFMMTAPGSANHRLWAAMADLGLMGELAAEPEVGDPMPIPTKKFYLTPDGHKLIPPLLQAAAVIRNSIPELA